MKLLDDEVLQQESYDIDNRKTILQNYFDEVGRIYDKNDNEYNIEYSPENREKLIQMNLKGVVKVAKNYLGNGLTLEELIAAGNEGLIRAFDKYNPYRSKFAKHLIEEVEKFEDKVPITWIKHSLKEACSYGSPQKQFDKKFNGPKAKKEYTKKEVIKWIEKNIKSASFNSIAMMWVEAAIRQELTNNSRLIRKSSSEIKKEKEGLSQKEVIIDLTQPISEDGNTLFVDTLNIQDDSSLEVEEESRIDYLQNIIRKLFVGIKLRDRRIIMKRFGIGYIRAMKPFEIAETEDMSVARVSQIIKNSLQKMQETAQNTNIDMEDLMDILYGDSE